MRTGQYTFWFFIISFLTYYSIISYGQTPEGSPAVSENASPAQEQTVQKPAVPGPSKNHILLPQGYIINGKDAKLVQLPEENRWFILFSSDEKPDESISSAASSPNSTSPDKKIKLRENPSDPLAHPIEVLPNHILATMVNIMGDRNNTSVTFRIWGEITTYKERNYIIVNDVGMLSIFGSAAPPEPDASKTKPQKQPSVADSAPAESSSSSSENQDALPEELRKALLAIPRPRPIGNETENIVDEQSYNKKIAESSSPAATSVKEETSSATPKAGWRDRELIMDRSGRLMYASDQNEWLFALDSGGPNQPDTPLVILPSQLLEVMEKLWVQSNHRAKFCVSGLVTVYQNRGFLLMRKMQVVYDQGNFQP